MPNFFISYRREDSRWVAGRLYDGLSMHFGKASVFRDIYTIEPGLDFVKVIEDAISQCDILLVLIGKKWLGVTDATGQRRLDDPEDFVRLEVQTGLKRNIRVIPVLVEGATMPSLKELPDPLATLARCNAFELNDSNWHADVGKLIEVAEKIPGQQPRQRKPAQAIQDPTARCSIDDNVKDTSFVSKSVFDLPYSRNPFFTGRDDILEQLHNALTSGRAATLTQPQAISGLGGIGKTQTAVEYAYRYRDGYKAVLWAKADSREALILGFVSIAGSLALPEKDDQDQKRAIAAVKRWLEGDTDWLLILDNADEPKLVEDFLPFNPKGHILMTSWAQVFDNLGSATPIELKEMLPEEARQFFLKRTGRSDPEPAEIRSIEQLTQELGYLPLALEQAGAYITKMKCSFQDYLSSYRERGLKLLEKTGVVIGKYPKSVATTNTLAKIGQLARASVGL